ncbi:YhgE/Pip family protein [Ureibacillus composti]
MLKQEWLSILKDKKYFASIAVMFIIPLLYSGMLLWAFWDPYGQLEELPVALVNNDKGANFDGESLHLGDELVKNLEDSAKFDFKQVTEKEANKMLTNKDAYIVIQIPKHFSENATTLLDESPQKLELEYKIDEASNYITSKIGDSAINQIRTEVNEQVSKTYAEQLFAVIERLSDGYGDAADGASKIKDGVVQLQDGTVTLKDYLYELAKGTVTLSSSTSKLVDGASSAQSGAEELANGAQKLSQGSQALSDGASTIQQGTSSLSSGITQFTGGVEKVASGQQALLEGQQTFQTKLDSFSNGTEQVAAGSQNLASSTDQLAAGIASLGDNLSSALAQLPEEQRQALEASISQLEESSKQIAQGANTLASGSNSLQENAQALANGHSTIVANSEQLTNGLQELTSNSNSLVEGATKVANGVSSLSENLGQFNTGVASVANGASSLNTGLSSLADGAKKLSDGTSTLSGKSGELADGSNELVDGADKLFDGTEQLTDTLADAKEESSISVSDKNYDMVASAVEVDKDVKNSVDNYGTGLAPYFISLGLFVGALILTNVYAFVQPAVQPTGLLRWFVSKCSVPFVVWIFQTVLLSVVLLYGLKMNVSNVPLFLLLMAVTSFAFIAIVQLLVVVLDDVGRFVALLFLILQLASSAGTFPLQLLPKTLQAFNSYMPMSYSVEAFRHVISTTDYGVVYENIALLAGIGIVCVCLTFMVFGILYKHRYSKQVVEN